MLSCFAIHPGARRLACGVLLAAVFGAAAQAPRPPEASETPAPLPAGSLAKTLQARVLEMDAASSSPEQRHELQRLYEAGGYQALWLDAAGRPKQAADEALALLAQARTHGLDPSDYGSEPLAKAAAELKARTAPADQGALAGFEAGLSRSLLSYLRHLQVGRVDPRAIRFRIPSRAQEHDYTEVLRSALAQERLRRTADEMAPDLDRYRSLRAALPRYRALAADAGLPPMPVLPRRVRPGEPHPALQPLHRRLVALGDLPDDDALPADARRYEGTLVEGVKRFQRRHGLPADGILGKSTQAALQVPLARRVRQIELALERLRWLPHLGGQQPLVEINIPMFRLRALDPAAPPLEMPVIVGRALDTQTPVFMEAMTHLIFRPYWNVPRSIVRDEILPALQRDPEHLRRQGMELVRGWGDDAPAVPASPENIALLAQGEGALRLRQRPGPRNSLGLVKFIFPNDANIYMHGTPARRLFSRTRRDFSHGCVRLEDPVAMAQWALKDQPEWTRERILAAMNGARPLRVNLTRPIQVIHYYLTATAMPDDGAIHFAEDIYGHDRTLDAALAARRSG